MMHWNYLDSLRNALNRHPTSKAKKPPVFCRFPSVENSSPIHIFHRRPHNDTHTNASNVSSFNQILRSLFTQFGLENPRSYIVVLAKPKLQSVLSQSCRVEIARVIGIWNCLLECQDWSPPMFLFTNYNHCILWHAIFEEAFIVTSGNFAKHIYVKCPKTKKKILTAKMTFDKCWRLQYWRLGQHQQMASSFLSPWPWIAGPMVTSSETPWAAAQCPHAFLPFLHP